MSMFSSVGGTWYGSRRAGARNAWTRLLLSPALAFASVAGGATSGVRMGAVDLRCEDLIDPLGIDSTAPRLSWRLTAGWNGARQTAYQVTCATRPELLTEGRGDLWDSGRIESDQSQHVKYDGKPINRGEPCHWKVRVWDERGNASPWSQSAVWTYAGLASDTDWQAQWIYLPGKKSKSYGISPWLRKSFEIGDTPSRAYVYVNALGYFHLFINGKRVGIDEFAPAVGQFDKRTLHVTYDVTDFLRKGENTIGLWLGRGWAGVFPKHASHSPAVRARLEIDYQAGASQAVVTDKSWQARPSCLTTTGQWKWNHFGGELLDGREWIEDWCQPGANTDGWQQAAVADVPDIPASSQMVQANRVIETLHPKSVTLLTKGAWLVDMGKAMTGTFEIVLPDGDRGHKVRMEFGDHFEPKKDPPMGRLNSFHQVSEYVFRGEAPEVFKNRFNYASCRYIRIENVPEGEITPDDVTGHLITTDLPTASAFECSDKTLNKIHGMMEHTLRCLMLGGYQVDCHSRERMGYGGDGQASLDTTLSLLRSDAFYRKWTQDWVDAQDPKTGGLPYVTPRWNHGGGPFWCGFLTAATLRHYQHYGDMALLRRNFPAIKRWFELVEEKTVDHLQQKFCGTWYLGDWASPKGVKDKDEESVHLFVNCYMIYVLEQAAEIAEALGKEAEANAWRQSVASRKHATHKRFFNEDQGRYANGYQVDYVLPLMTGVVPQELQNALFAQFEKKVLEEDNGHLGTGLSGTYMMIRYLQDIGRDDLIYTFASKTTYPSWGYMIENGATATWEHWGGQHSRIHNCYNSIGSWFIQGLGGIRPDPKMPGFRNAIIKPAMPESLTHVRATHKTIYGTIRSHWQRQEDGTIVVSIQVPPNTTATVYLPAGEISRVESVNGTTSQKADHVKFQGTRDQRAVYHVHSGNYEFRILPDA